MEVKIELEGWKCDKLIAMNNFVVEEITAYYSCDINLYGNSYAETSLNPIKIKIAYPINKKPTALEQKYPMLEDLQEYRYEKVINDLFSEMLWRTISEVKKY